MAFIWLYFEMVSPVIFTMVLQAPRMAILGTDQVTKVRGMVRDRKQTRR